MKSNATRIFLLRSIMFVLLSLYFLFVFAQPDYTFKNAALISGTDLHTGAIYRFSNVKSGVDAKVTIKSMSGGITLTDIDNNSTGFDEAFQPYINVATNSSGYVEFQIDFVNAGGNTAKSQGTVASTCIDVDGATYADGVLYEQDQVQFSSGGYYNFTMTGSNLQVLNPPGWVTIKNTSGASYPGIDTAAKDVMATVVNKNITGFKMRIGASNTSHTQSEIRYRSVYFKNFVYPNPWLLPNRTLLSFSGIVKQNGIQLNGVLSASSTYDKIVIERGNTSSYLSEITELPITNGGSDLFPFGFFDNSPDKGANYYRIILMNTTNHIIEISNVLMVKTKMEEANIHLNNTIVQRDNPVFTINAVRNEEVLFQVTDMTGRILYKSKVQLNAGTNNIYPSEIKSARGYGLAIIETPEEKNSVKILIQ